MESFLHLLAKDLVRKRGSQFEHLTIIFPNKRAGLFLSKALSQLIDRPVWMPRILTLGEFIERQIHLRQADDLTLIIKLYKSYRLCSGSTERFDDFYFWGQMLLSDFDDIDKYLASPKDVFANLAALKEIEINFPYLSPEQIELIQQFWKSFHPDKYSQEQQEFIRVWEKLYPTYLHFREKLLAEGLCYEGMGQRLFCERLSDFHTEGELIFAGFNALNRCEKKIFAHFRDNRQARFYWDYDLYYSTNDHHEAGHYIRENLKLFPNELGIEYFNHFRHNGKQLEYIAVPSTVGQAKLLPALLAEILPPGTETDYTETAIVLCDEQLLPPVLHSLPDFIRKINITMGYPARNTSIITLVQLLGELKRSAKPTGGTTYYYHKPVIALLNHKLINSSCPEETRRAIDFIRRHNIVYVAEQHLLLNDLTRTLFATDSLPLQDYLACVLRQLIAHLRQQNTRANAIEQEFLFHIFTRVQQINNTFDEEEITPEDKFYLQITGKVLQELTIPFSGEPLEGMQIMGLMETRMLDFKNLILLSANEGILPKGSHTASFIPYNLRAGFNLPTPEHRDTLFAYYFYRLLQRAERIKLLYTDTARGLTTGEASRFLLQIKYESALPIQETYFQNRIAAQDLPPITIEKTPEIRARLTRYTRLNQRGLSPSALNTYLECRLRFYFKYVADIREPDTLAEELDQRLLGTIFHTATQSLYQTLGPEEITPEVLEALEHDNDRIDHHIREAYCQVYDDATSPHESGANELVLSVVKKYVKKVLSHDLSLTPFRILSLETTYRMPLEIQTLDGTATIYLAGDIDRVDYSPAATRIIDYKTGTDRADFKSVGSLFDPANKQRNKAAFQTLLYCLLFSHQNPTTAPLRPGIYSTKLLFTPGYSDLFRCNGSPIRDFQPLQEEFTRLLVTLLEELFSPNHPFTQTDLREKCRTCPYREICHR